METRLECKNCKYKPKRNHLCKYQVYYNDCGLGNFMNCIFFEKRKHIKQDKNDLMY